MRTAIFFGLITIASAINDNRLEQNAVFYGIIGGILMTMDLFDFLKSIKK